MSGKEDPEREEKPAREGRKSWCEPGLVVPIMGSILLLVLGQMTNTFVDIKYGLEDSSDFSIVAEPPGDNVPPNDYYKTINVSVEDRHEFICPYGHTVYLKTETPDGLNAVFLSNNQKPPFTTRLRFGVDREKLKNQTEVKITINGIGGDGKIRNATYLLNVYSPYPIDKRPNSINPSSIPRGMPFRNKIIQSPASV
jgi:hypothetical protein